MRLGTHPFFDLRRKTQRRSLLLIAGLLFLVVRHAPAARAQQQNGSATRLSDLALQNLNRVAASAEEINAVLVKDAGLMVELKQ